MFILWSKKIIHCNNPKKHFWEEIQQELLDAYTKKKNVKIKNK